MLLKDKLYNIPDWSKERELNRWCDYIELMCIDEKDGLLSQDDIVMMLNMEADEKGSELHAKNADKIAYQVNLMYEQIAYRHVAIPDYYPFEYEDGCLFVKKNLNEKHVQYMFLLICSSIAFLDNSSSIKMTHSFEAYCIHYFEYLVSPDSEVHLFGTAREGEMFTGNLRNRLNRLAECFGARTTKSFDADSQFDVPSGDEGIDLVAFNKLDSATHIPIAIGQCTCSYLNWENKQKDISREYWRYKMEPLPPFEEYMFVSFFCRNANGKFENPTTITTCLIDRLRIFRLMELHNELLNNIDVLGQIQLKMIAVAMNLGSD